MNACRGFFLLPRFGSNMIMMSNSYSGHTHASAQTKKKKKLFLAHIIYGWICWRIGFCIIQCHRIIFIALSAMCVFFGFRSVVCLQTITTYGFRWKTMKNQKNCYTKGTSDIWLNAVNDETFHEGHIRIHIYTLWSYRVHRMNNGRCAAMEYEAYLNMFLLHSFFSFLLCLSIWKISLAFRLCWGRLFFLLKSSKQ